MDEEGDEKHHERHCGTNEAHTATRADVLVGNIVHNGLGGLLQPLKEIPEAGALFAVPVDPGIGVFPDIPLHQIVQL